MSWRYALVRRTAFCNTCGNAQAITSLEHSRLYSETAVLVDAYLHCGHEKIIVQPREAEEDVA